MFKRNSLDLYFSPGEETIIELAMPRTQLASITECSPTKLDKCLRSYGDFQRHESLRD